MAKATQYSAEIKRNFAGADFPAFPCGGYTDLIVTGFFSRGLLNQLPKYL